MEPERDIYDFVTKGTYSMELRTFVSGTLFSFNIKSVALNLREKLNSRVIE